MNIDERMKMLMENMKRLSSKHPQFTCGKFPPEWDTNRKRSCRI